MKGSLVRVTMKTSTAAKAEEEAWQFLQRRSWRKRQPDDWGKQKNPLPCGKRRDSLRLRDLTLKEKETTALWERELKRLGE